MSLNPFDALVISHTKLLCKIIILTLCLTMGASSLSCSKAPDDGMDHIINSIGIDFVLIPAGRFVMGEATREECTTCKAKNDETPRHPVRISKPFYLSTHEITQKQFLAVMKSNPSRFKGSNRPVDSVTWTEAKLFVDALNSAEKTSSYRLPTEAEWEYAARAGSTSAYHFGDDDRQLTRYAWTIVNSGGKTKKVGKREPNPFGLYDMYGNVFEWCDDWYAKAYYASSPQADPTGPSRGVSKVKRGGSKDRSARSCRSSARASSDPQTRSDNTGFRLVKTP